MQTHTKSATKRHKSQQWLQTEYFQNGKQKNLFRDKYKVNVISSEIRYNGCDKSDGNVEMKPNMANADDSLNNGNISGIYREQSGFELN